MGEERRCIPGQFTPPDDFALAEAGTDPDQSSTQQRERRPSRDAAAAISEQEGAATDQTGSGPLASFAIDPIENAADGASFPFLEVRAPRQEERLTPAMAHDDWHARAGFITGALLATLGVGCFCGWNLLVDLISHDRTGKAAVAALVERIIEVESNGCPNARNKRSSATGAGQFLDQTWLELIRAHRPDLHRRGEREALELRRDPQLAREITMRLAEQNAALLRARALPVTRGTLYLSHFAGGAGAVALLSAPDTADAAAVMASADATGRTTREKIVNANPFLKRFTVADLKSWADRKMDGPARPTIAASGFWAPTAAKVCL